MENESRSLTATKRECRSRAGSTRLSVPTGETNIHDLADDLLELFLLRLSSPISLVRAAAACKLWRRVIAADVFLRRFRSFHGPLVLGHYDAGVVTVFTPMPPSSGEAAAAVNIRDAMSLNFLAGTYKYMSDLFLTDCRDGLLAFDLLDSRVVVCNPWTKQYKVLPCSKRLYCRGAFLTDADETDTVLHMSNFRVIRVGFLRVNGRVAADVSVISASDKRWLSLTRTILDDDIRLDMRSVCVGRVGNSIFLSLESLYVIQVNERTGVLSSFSIPELDKINRNKYSYDRRKLRVVGRDARTLRLVRIVGKDLQVLQLRHGGKCVEEKRFDLSQLCSIEAAPDRSLWRFPELGEAVAHGCVVLSPDDNCPRMFSIDVESMEVVCVEKRFHAWRVFPYELPWPPTIKAAL